MPVSIPPQTLSGTTQTNLTSYATDPADHPTLEKLSALIPRLTQDELVGLGIAALDEGFEPNTMFVDYAIEVSHNFDLCVELIQSLTLPGKVALVRCLSELLAVSVGIVPTMPTTPSLPPVPPPHPENACGVLALEDAVTFTKAGHMNPAILLCVFSLRSVQAVAPDLLVQAVEQFADLKAALDPTHSNRNLFKENRHVSKSH